MRSTWLKIGAPLAGAMLIAGGLAVASQLVGEAGVLVPETAPALAIPRDAGLDAAPEPEGPPDAGTPDASWRYVRGALRRPPGDDEGIVCRQPRVEIERSEGCADGLPYPACRWRLPDPEGDAYEIWRNTTDDHRWARPGLVSLLLTTAAEYRRRWPDDHVVIGDLDAPGPRHQTHDRGVDVDMYLPASMIARSIGGGRYPDNYEGRSASEVRAMRARVMDLAKILATCADGQIRIYYNDPDLIRPFRAWFDAQGYVSEVGPAMRMHNDLHRFHFHLTIPETTAPLPPR